MYTVKKIETPDRGEMFAVVTGENARTSSTASPTRMTRRKTARSSTGAKSPRRSSPRPRRRPRKTPRRSPKQTRSRERGCQAEGAAPKDHEDDNHKPRAHAARAKAHVKRMAPKPTRRHK